MIKINSSINFQYKVLAVVILAVFGILFFCFSDVSAAEYYRVNVGATVKIDEHSVCKMVTNNGSSAIFVPTKTSGEWSEFRLHYPSGISLSNCVAPPPSAPTISCSTASASQINVSWTNVANESGYRIYRCTGSTCTPTSLVNSTGVNVVSWSNTGLSASTAYSYRVKAYNSGGESAYSNITRCTTQAAAPPNPAASLQNCGISPGDLIGGGVTASTGDLLVQNSNGYTWCSSCNDYNGDGYGDWGLACKVGTTCNNVDCKGAITQTESNGYVKCSGLGTKCYYCIVNKSGMSTPIIVNTVPTCTISGDRGDIYVRGQYCDWSTYDCTITGSENCGGLYCNPGYITSYIGNTDAYGLKSDTCVVR